MKQRDVLVSRSLFRQELCSHKLRCVNASFWRPGRSTIGGEVGCASILAGHPSPRAGRGTDEMVGERISCHTAPCLGVSARFKGETVDRILPVGRQIGKATILIDAE